MQGRTPAGAGPALLAAQQGGGGSGVRYLLNGVSTSGEPLVEDEHSDTPTVRRLEAGDGIVIFQAGPSVAILRPPIPRKTTGLYHAIPGASNGLVLPPTTASVTFDTMAPYLQERPLFRAVMLPEHEGVFLGRYSFLVNMPVAQPGDSQTWTAALYEYDPVTQSYVVGAFTLGTTNTVDAGTAGLTVQEFVFSGVDDITNTLGLLAVAFQYNTAPGMQFIKPANVTTTYTPSDTLTYYYDVSGLGYTPVTSVAGAPNPDLFVNGIDVEIPVVTIDDLKGMEDISGQYPVVTTRFFV